MNIRKNSAFFLLGGGAYVGLELLWRGRSHVSMFFAGGSCFLALGQLTHSALPYPLRLLAGSGLITAAELGTGLLVNRSHQVWDYRAFPGNFRGQICPAYSALWLPVSAAGMGLYDLAEKVIFGSRPSVSFRA